MTSRNKEQTRLKTLQHLVPNGDGWHLSLNQTWDESRLKKNRRPVLIVPGYGMNSYIFSFHPDGPSLEGFLATAGFEVWRIDLRAQGGSVSVGGKDNYRIEDLALKDLNVSINAALNHTKTEAQHVDIIGCSFGGTLMFIQVALNPQNQIGSIVAIGSPVRWLNINPIIRTVFAWPMLVGAVRIRGARKIAEFALPHLVRYVPWALSPYLNPEVTNLEAARDMVKTVEDPNRHINRQIAKWIRDRDLFIKGANLSDLIARIANPFLCIIGNSDGIVPPETARFSYDQVRSKKKSLIVVGDDELSIAHADLFISKQAHEKVYAPLAQWLAEQKINVKPVRRSRVQHGGPSHS